MVFLVPARVATLPQIHQGTHIVACDTTLAGSRDLMDYCVDWTTARVARVACLLAHLRQCLMVDFADTGGMNHFIGFCI
jgi:hypothetical protein